MSNFTNPILPPNTKTNLVAGHKYNLIINAPATIINYKVRGLEQVFTLPTSEFNEYVIDGTKIEWLMQEGGVYGDTSYNIDVETSIYEKGGLYSGPNLVDKSQSFAESVSGGTSGTCWSYTVPYPNRQAIVNILELIMIYNSGSTSGPLVITEDVKVLYTPYGQKQIEIGRITIYDKPQKSQVFQNIQLYPGDNLTVEYDASNSSYGAYVYASAKIDEVDN